MSQLITTLVAQHVFYNMATRKMGSLENLFAKFLMKQEAIEVGIFTKGKSLEKHILAVEKKFKELNLQGDQRVNFLIKTLDEDVLLEIQSRQDFKDDYDCIIDQLRSIHGETKTSVSLCTSVLEIKQKPGQKIKDYISEIRVSVMKLFPNESSEERERIMIMAFIEGLRNYKYTAILRRMNPASLQDAYEVLKNEHEEQNHMVMRINNDLEVESEIEMMKQKLNAAFEKIKQLEMKLSKITRGNVDRTPFNGLCHFCQKPGHRKRECKLVKRCQICNLTNHTTDKCYHKRENRNRRFRNVDNESVKSVTTSEIENNGENIINSHQDLLNEELQVNDAYWSQEHHREIHNICE